MNIKIIFKFFKNVINKYKENLQIKLEKGTRQKLALPV